MTILDKILNLQWDEAIKDTGDFLGDNPLAAAIAVGAVGWFAAPAIASYFAPAAIPAAGAMTVPTLATLTAADTAAATLAAATTARNTMLLGTGINVAGQFLSAKGAANDARQLSQEQRAFQEQQNNLSREDRRVSFVPQGRGLLSQQRNAAPALNKGMIPRTPEQVLALRKSGVV